MPLYDRAFLVISSPAVGTADGVFEFQHGLETDDRVEKQYLVGNAGTAISEAARFVTSKVEELNDIPIDSRRKGLSLDVAGGTHGGTLTFRTGFEDVRWGDGSGGDGQANLTKTDASGSDVHPRARLDVLQYWVANTLTDSRGRARLHIGEYTDGSFGGADPGQYKQFPIAIINTEARMPVDEPSDTVVTLQYRKTQSVRGLVDEVADWVGNITDADWLPDDPPERSEA